MTAALIVPVDLPDDPSPGEAWPLYPIHRAPVLAPSSISGSYRQRRVEFPCCGANPKNEAYGDSWGEITCAGQDASRGAASWRKRLQYWDAGYLLDSTTGTVTPLNERSDAA